MNSEQKEWWKELKSKVVLKTPWFEIEKKDFRLPGGEIIKDYYLIKKPASVQFVVVTENNKIILIKHYRPGAKRTSIEVPAGYVEKNETLEKACQREMEEEIGFRAKKLLKIAQTTESSSRFIGLSSHLFMAWNLVKIKNRKLDTEAKGIEIIEISVKKAIKMIETKKINDGPTIAAIFLAQSFIEKKKVK